MRRRLPIAIPLVLLSACSDASTGPAVLDPRLALAKAPSQNRVAAITVFGTMSDGVTATRIFGDGRLANGSAVASPVDPSIYQGGLCGVKGTIFVGGSGDAVFDPDGNSGPCGARRTLAFDFGSGPVSYAPFVNARQVVQLTLGESRAEDIRFTNMGTKSCEALRYSGATEGNVQLSLVRVTRSSDPQDPNVWTVESAAPHTAGCYVWSQGQYRFAGAYSMPVHFQFRQLP